MDIGEAKYEKRRFEIQVAKEIEAFEERTGLHVEYLDLERIDAVEEEDEDKLYVHVDSEVHL
jgi:hypothetical protein